MFAVLSLAEVERLMNAARAYLTRACLGTTTTRHARCTWFYRNKPRSYFDKVLGADGGVMRTLLKDASGDEMSPINGEIGGLFFLANVDHDGEPFASSPFGNTRLLVRAEWMLANSAVYFADFYCMNGKDHYVTLVVARPGSDADRLCASRLPKLSVHDRQNNPFIFYSNNELRTVRGKWLFVEVFFTENLHLELLKITRRGYIQYDIHTFGLRGTATQGGRRKVASCPTCRTSRVAVRCNRASTIEEF